MAWYLAPALVALRSEANRLFPGRSKVSDGTIGDTAHAGRTSDHNPKPDGRGGMVVDAFDLTHDPAHGLDAHAWVRKRAAAGDPRIKYAISNRQLWSPGSGWARYTGANAHEKHVHISVKPNMRDSTALAWFPTPAPRPPGPAPSPTHTKPPPTPTPGDDVLTPDQAHDLKAMKNYVVLATEQQSRIISLLEQIAARP